METWIVRRLAVGSIAWLGVGIMFQRRTKNLWARLRSGGVGLPILQQLSFVGVERARDTLCLSTVNAIGNRLQRPADSVDNGYFLCVSRSLRCEGSGACVTGVDNLFEWVDGVSGTRVCEIQMEIIVAQVAAAVCGDRKLPVRRYATRYSNILVGAVLVIGCGEHDRNWQRQRRKEKNEPPRNHTPNEKELSHR